MHDDLDDLDDDLSVIHGHDVDFLFSRMIIPMMILSLNCWFSLLLIDDG